jgi:hypothetical protein
MNKLAVLGKIISKWAYICAFMAFVLFTIFWYCNMLFGESKDGEDYKLVSMHSLEHIL